jgi:hypothetical protein
LAPGHLRAFLTAPPSSSSSSTSAQQLAAAAQLFNTSNVGGDQEEEDEDERLYTELLRDISLGDVDLGQKEDYHHHHHLLLHSPAPGCPEPGTAASSPLNGSDLPSPSPFDLS